MKFKSLSLASVSVAVEVTLTNTQETRYSTHALSTTRARISQPIFILSLLSFYIHIFAICNFMQINIYVISNEKCVQFFKRLNLINEKFQYKYKN